MDKDPNGKPSIDTAELPPATKPEELQAYRLRRVERWTPKSQSNDELKTAENPRLKQ